MKKLHFDYRMDIRYTESVKMCHFTIKCIPTDDDRQKLSNLRIAIDPMVPYEENEDSFGNRQIYGYVEHEHDNFSFHVSGDVEISQILYVRKRNDDRDMIFRHPFGLNRSGEGLKLYFDKLKAYNVNDDYDKCLFIMHCLHSDFVYEKSCTDTNTGAEVAWVLGKGVCQDYAHIFIALLHMAGIAAKYVVGMIIGEGQSHAWVEVLIGDRWIGFDPTNDLLVDDTYIKLGEGRDAKDCMINRGVMFGGGKQTQKVSVFVTEISN